MGAVTAYPSAAAIILAGGRATRLGGADKAEVQIDGRMLIDGVLQAVVGCDPIVVVGPSHLARPGVRVVREHPAFGGPVAALDAALQALPDAVEETWVLACDLPRAGWIIDALAECAMADDVDALVLRDSDGRTQPLAGRYRVAALRAAIAALPTSEGAAMRRLTEGLRVQEIDDARGASIDLDTWDDVTAYRTEQARRPRKGDGMTGTPEELADWTRSLAAALGVQEDVPITRLLDVTREVAHSVTRPAGPVTTYLIGRAVAQGLPLEQAIAVVRARIEEQA